MNAGFSAGGKPLNTKLSKLALWMPRSVTTWATATERLTGCPIRLRLRIQLCTGRSSGGNEATLRHILPTNTGTCQHRKQCIGNCPSAEGLVKQGWSGGGPAIILEFVGLVHRNMRLLAKGSCKKASFKLSLLYYDCRELRIPLLAEAQMFMLSQGFVDFFSHTHAPYAPTCLDAKCESQGTNRLR